MSNIIKKIAARAKQIRKAHPTKKWTDCIKQASRELKGSSKPGSTAKKRGAAKKKRRVGAVKSKNRQTGSSNRKRDSQRTAKAPGKRVVRHAGKKSTVYYERRKNRSDKPGKLSGTAYTEMILSRIKTSSYNKEQAEKRIADFKAKMKGKKGIERNALSMAIKAQQKFVGAMKNDIKMLRILLK